MKDAIYCNIITVFKLFPNYQVLTPNTCDKIASLTTKPRVFMQQ